MEQLQDEKEYFGTPKTLRNGSVNVSSFQKIKKLGLRWLYIEKIVQEFIILIKINRKSVLTLRLENNPNNLNVKISRKR